MPRDVSGQIQVEPQNGAHGFRPVYFLGRQIDDSKAYTSPLFARSSSSAQVRQPVDRPLRCGILSRLMTATDHTRNPPRIVACQLSPTADNVLAKTM